MKTIIDLLHYAAGRYGDKPYLGQKFAGKWLTVSYKEADVISSFFAAALLKHGIEKNENIAILAEGQSSWVLGEFGLLKAGAVSVPLSTKLSPDEILFRLDHSEAKAILVSENNFSKVAEILEKVAKKPLFIIISEKNDKIAQLASDAGLSENKNLFYFSELVKAGEEAIKDKNISFKLNEIEKDLSQEDTVTISYTSGTTGNPKGIMLSHKNYIHNATMAAEVVVVEEGWKSLIMLPLDHSFAHTVGLYIFLYRGLCMYFVDAKGGPMAALRNLPKNLLEVNPDFLLTVPALSGNFMKKMMQGVAEKGAFVDSIFKRGLAAGIAMAGNGYNPVPFSIKVKNFFPWLLAKLLVFPKLKLIFGKDIKFCIGGGALLEIKQQEFFNAIGVPVYQGYGLTENSPIICSNAPHKHKFGTSGIIIPDLKVRIMKNDREECAVGETGQIVTYGGSVMKGYFKNQEATKSTIIDDWLWSGDLGYMDQDDFLVVTGREKALLIAADGEKYSPETIEEGIINNSVLVNQLMAYNEQCRFTSVLVTLNTDSLKAVLKEKGISSKDDNSIDRIIDMIREDILAFAANPDYAFIPAQWKPASFAIIPDAFDENNGLINSTMKLVRHKVKEHYMDRIDEIYAKGAADPYTEGNRAALRTILASI